MIYFASTAPFGIHFILDIPHGHILQVDAAGQYIRVEENIGDDDVITTVPLNVVAYLPYPQTPRQIENAMIEEILSQQPDGWDLQAHDILFFSLDRG